MSEGAAYPHREGDNALGSSSPPMGSPPLKAARHEVNATGSSAAQERISLCAPPLIVLDWLPLPLYRRQRRSHSPLRSSATVTLAREGHIR